MVNTLTKDNTAPETTPNEDDEMPKLTVDDHEEMTKGRQKELNSLTEMGAMTIVKRSETVGKRTIRTPMGGSRKRRTSEIKASPEGTTIDAKGGLSPRCFHQHRRRCL